MISTRSLLEAIIIKKSPGSNITFGIRHLNGSSTSSDNPQLLSDILLDAELYNSIQSGVSPSSSK